jgi:hypothetical protein
VTWDDAEVSDYGSGVNPADSFAPAGAAIMIIIVVAVFLIAIGLILWFVARGAIHSYQDWMAGRQGESTRS